MKRLHELLLDELRGAGGLDSSRAAVDPSHLHAVKGGPATGPSPVDRGKTGSKHHLIVEAHGRSPPHIARRGTGHGSGLGVHRWVVEGTIALLHWFRRLRIRWEIRDDIHHALVTLGCAILCWRRLRARL